MHDRETVELFLLAREEGMSVRDAALLAGVSRSSAARWSAGRLPRSYTGEPWGSGRITREGGSAGGGADMDDIMNLNLNLNLPRIR